MWFLIVLLVIMVIKEVLICVNVPHVHGGMLLLLVKGLVINFIPNIPMHLCEYMGILYRL